MSGALIISAEDADRALRWLIEHAKDRAAAHAARVRAERMLKHTKARLMKEHAELSLEAQKREAYASPEYVLAVEELAAAVRHDEHMRALAAAAQTKLDLYRTQEATRRASR